MLNYIDVPWEVLIWSSMLGTICFSISVVVCLCGCKTSVPKDELTGIEGCVKKRNPEEFVQEVNANNITPVQLDLVSVNCETDKKLISTAKRSLPDLPIDKNNIGGEVSWEPNGDAGSELYATVGLQNKKKKEQVENDSRSPSTTYAQVKGEHPYDKLKKIEHPYAQVRHNRESQVDSDVPSTSQQRISIEIDSSSVNRSLRGRITSSRDIDSEIEESPVREPSIHAATAIAGHISANDDLPYMTPPTHFSGDSQDSTKGYTSISVREPLSTIIAETKSNIDKRQKNVGDGHYATVSDDSDEMYAAIDDPTHVYTSESETYAQIQPGRTVPEMVSHTQQHSSVNSARNKSLSSHSRPASSSSGSSSEFVGSPKLDKSQIPPPPDNVEDMYAKVNKRRRDMEQKSERTSTESCISESSDSVSYKLQVNQLTDASRSSTSHLSKTPDSSLSPCNRKELTDPSSSSDDEENGCYERLGIARYDDPGYESVNRGPPSDSDPNYEQLRPQEHEYASIARNRKWREPHRTDSDGYARVERVESDVTDGYVRVDRSESDAADGYARVERNESDAADGYARVKRNESDVADGYARVKRNESDVTDGYARVKRKESDTIDGYSKIKLKNKSGKSTEDDGYATVIKNTSFKLVSDANEFELDDPNYECVNSIRPTTIREPPYQLLKDCETGSGAVDI